VIRDPRLSLGGVKDGRGFLFVWSLIVKPVLALSI
jgi:hypothetical protein